jgi:hypothetical protein
MRTALEVAGGDATGLFVVGEADLTEGDFHDVVSWLLNPEAASAVTGW